MAVITLATLLKIKIPSVVAPLLYQNYQPTPFVFNGESYLAMGFEIQNYSQLELSLDSESVRISIKNTSLIRSLLRQYNDLKQSAVTIFHVQPGVSVPPIGFKLSISFATTEAGVVLFTLDSPTNALTGKLNQKYITTTHFPDLPYYRPQL